MKKLLICALSLALILTVVGCTNNESPVNTDGQTQQQNENQQPESPKVTLTKFEQFEKGLKEENLTFDKVTMGADLIGAEQGIKYKVDDWSVELYKFDKTSDAYKYAEENKAVKMQGFGDIEVKVNDDMVMIDNRVKNDMQEVISNIFEQLK